MKRHTADVAVVGAGVAGLAAAGTLAREGLEVLVVEARDRLGGRILTAAGLPPLEAGAEFLSGEGAAARLLRAAGGVFVESPERHVRLEDGRPRRLALDDALAELRRAVRPHRRGRDDRTLAAALEAAGARADTAELATRYVEQYHAAPAAEVSAAWVAAVEESEEGGGGGTQVQTLGGLDRLPRLLAAALPHGAIRLSSEATAVRTTRGRVRVLVRTPAEAYEVEARHAIVTVPLSLMAAGSPRVDFPPAEREQMTRLRLGAVVKLGLRFRSPFWADRLSDPEDGPGPAKFIHCEPPFPTWWTSAGLDAPTLVAWAGAGAAAALAGLDRDALLDAAIGQLGSVFKLPRRAVADTVEEVVFHDWSADRWSRGAYSHALPGGAEAAARLGRLRAGGVLLAGEAVSAAPGTVDGALASGTRAARRVLGAVR